jgi:hypothetical protein
LTIKKGVLVLVNRLPDRVFWNWSPSLLIETNAQITALVLTAGAKKDTHANTHANAHVNTHYSCTSSLPLRKRTSSRRTKRPYAPQWTRLLSARPSRSDVPGGSLL